MYQLLKTRVINATKACEITIFVLLLLSKIQHGYSDCLVGDIMYIEGQSAGHIGYECLNETSYDGVESICGPDGKLIRAEKEFTCDSSVPNCVQCGERGIGAALCLSSTDDLRDNCTVISSPEAECVVESDCPTSSDPYCGYDCADGTCIMWCERGEPTCTSEADCPVSSDPYCGYSCLDGICMMYCEGLAPPSGSSCTVETDCPTTDDPYCGYSCLDGTCMMWCEDGESGQQGCNSETDSNCCATMIPPSFPPPDDSTCWQWWTPPANGIPTPDMTPPPTGCDYQPCQDAVCACDSYCCDAAWDLSCRGYEENYFVDGCSAKILCCEAA